MKWTFILWIVIYALTLPLAAQPTQGAKMRLESTHPTPGVTLLAASRTSDLWAAAGNLETTIFKGDTEIKKLRFWTRVPQMAFSPDDKMLYAEGLEADIASGAVRESPTQSRWGRLVGIAAAYFPVADTAIVLLRDRPSKGLDREVGPIDRPQLQVVDGRNGETIHVLDADLGFDESLPMAIHQDWVAINAGGLQVWNWHTGASIFKEGSDDFGPAAQVAISADGQWIVVGSPYTGTGSIWDTHTWRRVWQGALATSGVVRLAFSPSNTNLLAVGGQKNLSLWKIDAQGKLHLVGKKLPIPVQDLAFDRLGQRLLVATGDSTRVYSIQAE